MASENITSSKVQSETSSHTPRYSTSASIFLVSMIFALLVFSSWSNRTWDEHFIGSGWKVIARGVNSGSGPELELFSPVGKVYFGEATMTNGSSDYSGKIDDLNLIYWRKGNIMRLNQNGHRVAQLKLVSG